MNKMSEVAKILDIELEEEFGIEGRISTYKLTEKGLLFRNKSDWRLFKVGTLTKLLTGELEIEWIPKDEEKVWAIFSQNDMPCEVLYHEGWCYSETMLERGMITRTEQEAIDKMKEMGWWEE